MSGLAWQYRFNIRVFEQQERWHCLSRLLSMSYILLSNLLDTSLEFLYVPAIWSSSTRNMKRYSILYSRLNEYQLVEVLPLNCKVFLQKSFNWLKLTITFSKQKLKTWENEKSIVRMSYNLISENIQYD